MGNTGGVREKETTWNCGSMGGDKDKTLGCVTMPLGGTNSHGREGNYYKNPHTKKLVKNLHFLP